MLSNSLSISLKNFIYSYWQIISVLLLGSIALVLALYLQYGLGQIPCVLCIAQRMVLMAGMACCFISLLFSKKTIFIRFFIFLSIFFTGLGIYFSGRQVYLEHFPLNEISACAPSFSAMLQIFSPYKILEFIFYGTPECSKSHAFIFGVTLAEVSLFLFILNFLLLSHYFFTKKYQNFDLTFHIKEGLNK